MRNQKPSKAKQVAGRLQQKVFLDERRGHGLPRPCQQQDEQLPALAHNGPEQSDGQDAVEDGVTGPQTFEHRIRSS